MSLSVPSFSLDVLNIFACSVNLFFTQLVLQDFAFFADLNFTGTGYLFGTHLPAPSPLAELYKIA